MLIEEVVGISTVSSDGTRKTNVSTEQKHRLRMDQSPSKEIFTETHTNHTMYTHYFDLGMSHDEQ